VRLLLENTAGQGTYLGGEFAHLAQIMEGFGERSGSASTAAMPTLPATTWPSAEGYAKTMAEFDRDIGFRWLFVFHLNDSQKGCGNRVDRHAHIGAGTIGVDGFARLVRDERFFLSRWCWRPRRG